MNYETVKQIIDNEPRGFKKLANQTWLSRDEKGYYMRYYSAIILRWHEDGTVSVYEPKMTGFTRTTVRRINDFSPGLRMYRSYLAGWFVTAPTIGAVPFQSGMRIPAAAAAAAAAAAD